MDAIIIAFASGKGGTGKSTTAVYVGAALAALQKKVVLVELATGLRSVDIIAGVSERAVFDIADVLNGSVEPARAVVASPLYPGLSIMPAPDMGGAITKVNLQALCTRLRPHFDFILLDVAMGFGPAFEAAAAVAHRMFLVETPDPVALRDGRTLVDVGHNLPPQLRLILNRVDARRILSDGVLVDLDEAIDIVGVRLIGVVPESAVIQKAAAKSEALPQSSVAAQVYTAIAQRILGQDRPLIYQS